VDCGTLPQQSGMAVRATHGIPPEGDQAGQLIGAPSETGKRLVTWLEDTGRHETTSLREDAPLKADVIVYDREAAKIEAQKPRPGLTLRTDGSRQDNGACGYSGGLGERHARLAWCENPHENQPGSLRWRMCRNRESVGSGSGATATLEATR